MNHNAIYMQLKMILTLVLLSGLAGCAGSVKAPAIYTLEVEDMAMMEMVATPATLNLLVEEVYTHDMYKGRHMMASPEVSRMARHQSGEWGEPTPVLLTSAILNFLTPRYSNVVPAVLQGRLKTDYSLLVYLETMAHAKRGSQWFAVLRLRYEIVRTGSKELVATGRYDMARPLAGSELALYVGGQNISCREFLDKLVAKLKELQ